MFTLFNLPQDILFTICLSLAPQEILALKQTCRVLHAFTSSDYIWHQLPIHLPLDLPQTPDRDLASLPGDYLQPAVVRALRLEHNWRKKASTIRRLTRIPHGTLISQMQIFGQKWLLTLSRPPGVADTSRLSVWKLPGPKGGDARLVASLDTAVSRRFAVGIQRGGDRALIATFTSSISSGEHIMLFSLSLNEDESRSVSDPDILRHMVTVPVPRDSGVLCDIHINGPIVIGDLAVMPGTADPDGISFKMLLINADTNFKALIPASLPVEYHYDEMRTRVYPGYVLTIGWKPQKIYIIASTFPPEALSPKVLPLSALSSPACKTLSSWGPTLLEHEVVNFSANFDLYLSHEPELRHINRFSSVLFYSWPLGRSRGEFFQFPLDFSAAPGKARTVKIANPVMAFSLPPNTTQDLVCLGKTGQRAVWFERKWDSDELEYRVMKASLPVNGDAPMVEMLLPKHMALPFELHTCNSIYFEEASCRVCFSLHTGDVYVMEF